MPAGTGTVRVTTADGCTWTAQSNVSWLSVGGGSAGSGSGTIDLSYSSNYDAPREGLVMVRWPTPTAGQNVRVSQAGCHYGVSTTAIGFAAAGGSGNFDVVQQSDPTSCGGPLQDACVWTPTTTTPWITLGTTGERKGDDKVTFSVAPNSTSSVRVGTVVVRDQVVQITQAGM